MKGFAFLETLTGEFFLCHIFAVKSAQNLGTVLRTTPNLRILPLLSAYTIYSQRTFLSVFVC